MKPSLSRTIGLLACAFLITTLWHFRIMPAIRRAAESRDLATPVEVGSWEVRNGPTHPTLVIRLGSDADLHRAVAHGIRLQPAAPIEAALTADAPGAAR
jgi:hypothetical protein